MGDMGSAVVAERGALAKTLHAVGPDAPTLAGYWTAADIAAHIVSLDRLHGVPTFLGRALVSRWAFRLDDVAGRFSDASIRSTRRKPFDWAVARLNQQPPRLLLRPSVATVGLFEVYVHHEDIRRASDPPPARPTPDELLEVVPWLLRYQRTKLPSAVKLCVRPHGASELAVGQGPEAVVEGPTSEIVLWLAGRRRVAGVALLGDDAALELVQHAPARI